MRASSLGNPNHDELGRFCSADKCKTKSAKTKEEYAARTAERRAATEEKPEVNGKPDRAADQKRADAARKKSSDEVLFVQRFGDTQVRCHAAIVKSLPKKEYKFSNGYAELGQYEKGGAVYTVYKDKDDDGQFSYFAVKNKEQPRKEMPWESGKYKNNKNGKLLWLMDHPESKYNDPDFIDGIKRIEYMADRGVSASKRKEAFRQLAKRFDMTEDEAANFISEEFLK